MKRAFLVAAMAAVLAVSLGGSAEAACPDWIEGEGIRPGGGSECWVPIVTYRHNTATMHGAPAVYETRIQQLANVGQMFPTKPELIAYIETTLQLKGFWIADAVLCGDGSVCVFIPPSAFDRIEMMQIVHPSQAQ